MPIHRAVNLAVAALALACLSCYAHYSWIAVDVGSVRTGTTDRLRFSDVETETAVRLTTEVARSVGFEVSPMSDLRVRQQPRQATFRDLMLYQGRGENRNVLLTIAIKDDDSVLRLWLSDLDNGHETAFARRAMLHLETAFREAFPRANIASETGRKLRIYAG